MYYITLYLYFASGTSFLYGVLRVQASTAVQPVRSTQLVHFSSPPTQHYPTLCLYRPPNTSIPMQPPLCSCCTGVCIYTCALRQTPHGHIHRGKMGSVRNALTLYLYFTSGTSFLCGVLRVQVSIAAQPVHSTPYVHSVSPHTQHYSTLCLYRPPNTMIKMHTSLHFRCTVLCIYTCALRQTPHGHMGRGVLGSVCNALTLYV